MSLVPKTRTWEDLARSVAAEFGIDLSYLDANYVLWEYTGFPSFWHDNPIEECTDQLRRYFTDPVGYEERQRQGMVP